MFRIYTTLLGGFAWITLVKAEARLNERIEALNKGLIIARGCVRELRRPS